MPKASDERDQTLWNIENGSIEHYWKEYEAVRPKYSDSHFLDVVYQYHESKSPATPFSVAHDVACGAGKAGRELAVRFDSVVASDSNGTSLNAMRASCSPEEQNIQYVACAAEQIADHIPAVSADLIAAAECVPILDMPIALESFSRVLKQDGTLAMWFYGRLHFAEEPYHKTCQPLLDEIMEVMFYHVINSGSPEGKKTWATAAETMESWLDNVYLPPDKWRLVQRHKWNNKSTHMGMGKAADGLNVVPKSCIQDGEKMIEKEESTLWQRLFGIAEVQRYLCSAFPGIDAFIRDSDKIQQLIRELTHAMGGRDCRRKITWPVSLILATPCIPVP